MSQILDIVTGHLREFLGTNDELSDSRLEICEQCLLYKYNVDFGPMCDKGKWISKDGTKVSQEPKDGYTRGCGCRLKAKTRNPKNKCIISKW